jgi:hypothetical protein
LDEGNSRGRGEGESILTKDQFPMKRKLVGDLTVSGRFFWWRGLKAELPHKGRGCTPPPCFCPLAEWGLYQVSETGTLP